MLIDLLSRYSRSGSDYELPFSRKELPGQLLAPKVDNGNFLIDVGRMGRQIVMDLSTFGVAIRDLTVFGTYEHGDHSQGFRGLAESDRFQ
jgi:metal-dependent hydrolase (beta-lactamase superfamily II)